MPPAKPKPFRFTDLERWTRPQLLVLKTLMAYLPGSGLGSEFKQAIRDALSKLTGAEVDLWLDSIGPSNSAAVMKKLPDPACLVEVTLSPTDHHVLLDLDLKLAGMVVDKMLGGSGEDADPARPLSSIERGLVGFVLLRLLHAAQTVLAEEQQVALRLKHIHSRPDDVLEMLGDSELVVMGFKVFLDMQVAYARLIIPSEMIRTQLAVTMEPGGPLWTRRLQGVRERLGRVAHLRTTLVAEAGRTELTEGDLAGVERGDILMVEQTGLKKQGDTLQGTVEVRVGEGKHGVVRGNLVDLEDGTQGVEITQIETLAEPPAVDMEREMAEEASPAEAVEGGSEEEQQQEALHTPLRPRGGRSRPRGPRGFSAGAAARGVGGDACGELPDEGEHQNEDEEQEEPQEETPAEEAGPSDNLGETEGLLKDIALPVVVELGRIKSSAGEVVGLRPGQILELRRAPNDPVNITVNGKMVAQGELVEVEGELGVRLLSVVR